MEEIIIVSGLPRSGTSMMMQMVSAAGIEILTDEIRKADQSNPKGYYEYEPVKKLLSDNSWMPQAKGKCVKIIAQLLPKIDLTIRYKIIFMNRNIDEVLKSQQVMLGKADQPANPAIKNAFIKQVETITEFMNKEQNISWIKVEHQETINNPNDLAQRVAEFLGTPSKIQEMAKVVNPDLYRNRN